MELYAILRRNGRRSVAKLELAAKRSTEVGNKQMADDIRWIRLKSLGCFCREKPFGTNLRSSDCRGLCCLRGS